MFPQVYEPLEEYYYEQVIFEYAEGDVNRYETVLKHDLIDFYMWLAFKNLKAAKEEYLIKNPQQN